MRYSNKWKYCVFTLFFSSHTSGLRYFSKHLPCNFYSARPHFAFLHGSDQPEDYSNNCVLWLKRFH